MEEYEQLEMCFEYDDKINKICNLKKSKKPLTSKVEIDEYTKKAQENFDFDFNGINTFYPFLMPNIFNELEFNILAIVGASGTGKSTFSKYFGEEKKLIYDNNKAIISHFENPEIAVEKLCAVGLNSIPTWCKPRNVLSIGEGFRCDLARRIEDNCIIDEFTSNVDRNVALSCSKSIGKYIRNKNLKKCVFVSCHKDFIDCLCPDYVVDLDDECIYDTRRLPTRKFEIQIFERNDKQKIWNIFRRHHYLSGDINVACKMFCAYLNENIVGMCAILPQPSNIKNAWRIHRLVILPDYQGLGIGTKLLEEVCKILKLNNKIVYLRTSNEKLRRYCENNKNTWKETARSGTQCPQHGVLWKIINNRIAFSYKFIGKSENNNLIKYEKVKFVEKEKNEKKYEQIDLFMDFENFCE